MRTGLRRLTFLYREDREVKRLDLIARMWREKETVNLAIYAFIEEEVSGVAPTAIQDYQS
jgi:hypothetical protein